jgi:hypothetical protein
MATVRIQLRRGTSSQWDTANPTLAAGEIGIETDTNTFKFGDGTTAWNSLDYALSNTVDDYILLADKGVANGVATLDGSGKVPYAQIPSIDELSQDAVNSALVAGTGITKVYNDGANTITVAVDTSVIATKAELAEVSQDSINDALVAGEGLNKTYDDVNNLITIDIDSTVATLTGTQTLTNKTLTSPVINTPTGIVKADVGLSNVDNTSDVNKPVSTAQAAADTAVANAAASALSSHESDTTDVHGIVNTANLITTDGLQSLSNKTLVGPIISSPVINGNASFEGNIVIEGTADDFETTLSANPTADRSIVFPDNSGTISLTSDLNAYAPLSGATFTGAVNATDLTLSGNLTVNGTTTNINTVNLSVEDKNVVLGDTVSPSDASANGGGISLKGTTDKSLSWFDATDSWTSTENFDVAYGKEYKIDGTTVLSSSQVLGKSMPTGTIVGTSDSQTLTNKTIAIGSNTISGTLAELNSAISDTNLVSIDGAETLTNKTLTSPVINGPTGLSKNDVGLSNVDDVSDLNKPVSTATQTALDLKANIAGPSFSGTVSLPSTTSIGDVSSSEIATLNGVTSAIQTQLDSKAPSAGPSFSGTVVLPSTTSIGDVSALEIETLNGVTSSIQTQLNARLESATAASTYAPIASPTFTGIVSGITKSMVGLANVDNTADTAKPVSTATQTALDLKANLAGPTFTGTVTLPGTTSIGDVSATEIGYVNGVTSAIQTQLDAKLESSTASSTYAPKASPTFTGTVTLPSTTSVGNVSNTEIGYLDGVTSAIQTQIDAKLASATAASTYAPIASPTFTGTVSGISKSMVGLGNVDNTSDANKPVSTATQTALDAKLALAGGTMTGALTLSGAPTTDLHAATKAYVDNVSSGINFHQPVRVATTGNITLSGTQTIDGVAVIAGDRVLVKDQTTQTQNGIYVVAAGSWTRATDADNTPNGELAGGDFTLVLEGTVNSGYGYVCSNTSAITIGTTNVTYAAFNAAKAVTAGSGLTESTPGTIDIATGGVTSAMIADGTIATGDLADGAVTSAKIADGTIVNSDINASAAIDWTKLAISSTVSATELGYVDGVTSAIQTQLDAKLASATASSTYAPIASPTFTGTVTVAASGVAFTDGTQTKEGVPSRTTIYGAATGAQQSAITSSATLSTLGYRDSMIEANSSSDITLTIPLNSATAFPVGTSIDVVRVGTGNLIIAGSAGVTINATPQNATNQAKLRAQWSSATLLKRGTDSWIVMGDLSV